jgi:malonyl-CoA O-methyltransferase
MNTAQLQASIRDELLDRLRFVALQPQTVLDLGVGAGSAARELRRRFPKAFVIAADIAPARVLPVWFARARRPGWFSRRLQRVRVEARRLPFPEASVDLVFSNLMLASCGDLDPVLAQIHRVLRPGGLFTFSTLGPETLRELREAWAEADRHGHVGSFLDLHDVGDALGRSGFAEPVLDVDRYTLRYGDPMTLLRDLKASGSRNFSPDRSHGLTGRGTLARMTRAYERHRRDGQLPATAEVVYGTAWGTESRLPRMVGGEAVVPLSRIRRPG